MSRYTISCHHCGKQATKYSGHVKENLKLGNFSYCSKNCSYKHIKTGKTLTCDNNLCKKSFYRVKNQISDYNFCSRSCAAIINNKIHPKWPPRKCKNHECTRLHNREGSLYCSMVCIRVGRFKYTRKEILGLLKRFSRDSLRAPAKRDVPELSHRAIHMFGSWNTALELARIEAQRSHDHRMYKRARTKAVDGHICDSVSEALIDNWLHKNGIAHERSVKYPNTKHSADWGIGNNIFVEYFGLAKDSPRYDRAIKEKQKICKKNGIRLVEIYPSDLYPKVSLDNKLTVLKQ